MRPSKDLLPQAVKIRPLEVSRRENIRRKEEANFLNYKSLVHSVASRAKNSLGFALFLRLFVRQGVDVLRAYSGPLQRRLRSRSKCLSTQVLGPDLKGRMLIKAYTLHTLGTDPVVCFTGRIMACFQRRPSMMREGKYLSGEVSLLGRRGIEGFK